MLDNVHPLDPEASFAQPEEKEIAVAITIESKVGTNRSIVLQTYMGRDAPLAQFNRVLDKLTATADRQEARLQIEEEEAQLALEQKTLKQFEEDFQRIDATNETNWVARGKKGSPVLSAQEEAQKKQAKDAVLRYRDGIAKRLERIAKCKAVIAKVD